MGLSASPARPHRRSSVRDLVAKLPDTSPSLRDYCRGAAILFACPDAQISLGEVVGRHKLVLVAAVEIYVRLVDDIDVRRIPARRLTRHRANQLVDGLILQLRLGLRYSRYLVVAFADSVIGRREPIRRNDHDFGGLDAAGAQRR